MKLAVVLACAAAGCERDSPSVPPGAMVGRHVQHRRDLEGWMNPVPTHGVVSSRNGLGAYGPVEERVSLDVDTRTLTSRFPTNDGRDSEIKTRTLPADDVRMIWELAELAWRAPPPAHDDVSDFLELVIAADGDDVMLVSAGGPIHPSAAARLTTALRTAAGFPYP